MPMKVGIIGTGWGCNVQIPFFRAAGLEVTAIYSRDMAKAKKMCDKLKVPHAFDSVAALCASPEVDLVSVVSPTYLHAAHALEVLRAGKHLLSDKPTAVTAAEAATIVAEAQRRPKQIAIIDHEMRFLHYTQAARDMVTSGAIGPVRHVAASFLVNMGGLGKNHSWWHEREKGGGVSGALGVHVIDLCAFITGERITKLSGLASTFIKAKAVKGTQETKTATADDCFSIAGSLSGGGAINITVNGLSHAKPERQIRIVGELGSIVVNIEQNTTLHFDAKGKEVKKIEEPDMSAPDAFAHGTFLIAKALATSEGSPSSPTLAPACQVADGAYVQSVVDAMLKSSDAGSVQAVAAPLARL
eukprot:gnl/TRDRNA2_/TRDRNA2_156550_c0_seq1.p1 gnl/TRDRNA2_/TRDRNA2_156550_c0~~gnl/TRDRNA2_/TRDRNA2_156550_c0_seq1.p1  ORF type:complete len:358 (-),score=81.15 gnl/TRDRNA2_/TRDRNA2_156550_c0_seq1:106-1179(-)